MQRYKHMKKRVKFLLFGGAGFALAGIYLNAQSVAVDPGVRGGPPAAGGPVQGLTSDQNDLFTFVTGEFTQLHSVGGNIDGEEGNGLGPMATDAGRATNSRLSAVRVPLSIPNLRWPLWMARRIQCRRS